MGKKAEGLFKAKTISNVEKEGWAELEWYSRDLKMTLLKPLKWAGRVEHRQYVGGRKAGFECGPCPQNTTPPESPL